jgi:hypothetical protein
MIKRRTKGLQRTARSAVLTCVELTARAQSSRLYWHQRLMMKFDLDAIIAFFNAQHELSEAADPRFSSHQLSFADARLRYSLCIMPGYGTIGLAADPDEPIQGCPMLEYGFTCSEIQIGASAYSHDAKAIRFYEHRDTRGGLRLTITPRVDGNWYIWACVGGDADDHGNVRIR